ncbi:MAG: class I SAM-dependent methyltransferase [Nitrospirota bacterium]|nr:class I SAM-dependent methyltransferase [Nitrospirota bacterium]
MNKTGNVLPELEATGERFLPEMQGTIALEHLHRYAMAKDFAAGKIVLDIACGEGYGSAVLAGVAARVYGVDIAPDAIAHAKTKYQRPNMEFLTGRCADIPLADGNVDLVVSFETIEHHTEHEEMFAEIKRVLRPGGLMIMSSPDKLEYTERANHANAFHVKELYAEEFQQLVERYFTHVAILGQRVLYASAILLSDRPGESIHYHREHDAGIQSANGLVRPCYQVAVASDAALPSLAGSLFEEIGESDPEIRLFRHHLDHAQQRIAGLEAEVAGLKRAINSMLHSHSWRATRPLRGVANLLRAITGKPTETEP